MNSSNCRQALQEIHSALIEGAYRIPDSAKDICLKSLEGLITCPTASHTTDYSLYQRDVLLQCCAHAGSASMMCKVLAAGIGPDYTTTYFVLKEYAMPSPLHLAVIGDHLGVMEALVRAGAASDRAYTGETDKNCMQGETPLSTAARKGTLEAVKMLVQAGASLEKADSTGLTAICCAAGGGHTEIVRFLVENGASVDHTSVYGMTPLACACKSGHFETIKVLVDAGSDLLEASDPSPLALAAYSGCAEAVEYLLRKGAKESSFSVSESLSNYRPSRLQEFNSIT